MKQLYLLITITFAFYLGSCASASTELTEFKNPDYYGKGFKNCLVFMLIDDLEIRRVAEDGICSYFKTEGYSVTSSLSLFSPLKEYSDKELNDIMSAKGIEGLLVINLMDYTENSAYVPQSSLSTTTSKVSGFGDYIKIKSSTSTQNFGGYSVKRPIVKIETAVFSPNFEGIVWYCQSTTKGNGFAKINTLVDSYSEEIFQQLKENSLLRK